MFTSSMFSGPLRELGQNLDLLPDFDDQIITYCGSDHRSTIAMSILRAHGYTDVLSLNSGFAGWVEAGFPTAEYAVQ